MIQFKTLLKIQNKLGRQTVSKRSELNGFTIVELLVVIVVIGILATITAVSYVGVSAKAKTAVLQSDLKNASSQIDMYQVENSQYPTSTSVLNDNKGLKLSPNNTLLSYTYDDTANYYCLTMKSGTIVTSIKNNASVTNGYCMRNLVKNGDFSNGTVGWGTVDIAGTLSAVNGVAQHTSDGTDAIQYLWQHIASTEGSHKIYSRIDFKSASYPAKVWLDLGCTYPVDGMSNCMFSGYNILYTQNTWISYSRQYAPIDLLADYQDIYGISLRKSPLTVIDSGTVVQFDNAVFIDLTATFGVGNEPTQAAMDTMLAKYPTKWFEGTVIVTK